VYIYYSINLHTHTHTHKDWTVTKDFFVPHASYIITYYY